MVDTDRRIIPIRDNDTRGAAAFLLASSGFLISAVVGLLIAIFCVIAFAQGSEAEIVPILSAADRPDDKITQSAPALIGAEQLPSISTIDAQTDITVFLRDNVSPELRLAALRRAWLIDPEIHNFKGLQEVDWDFDKSNSIPGFGTLGPEFDIARMVAQIIGTPIASCSTTLAIAYTRTILANMLFRRAERTACE